MERLLLSHGPEKKALLLWGRNAVLRWIWSMDHGLASVGLKDLLRKEQGKYNIFAVNLTRTPGLHVHPRLGSSPGILQGTNTALSYVLGLFIYLFISHISNVLLNLLREWLAYRSQVGSLHALSGTSPINLQWCNCVIHLGRTHRLQS